MMANRHVTVKQAAKGTALAALIGAVIGQPCEGQRSTATIRDSGGVRIVTNTAPAKGEGAYRILPAPELDLGGGEDPNDQFSGYSDWPAQSPVPIQVWVIAGGNLLIRDTVCLRLYRIDSAGRQIRLIGRSGDGPGEFRFLFSAGLLSGDTVVALDLSHRRLSWFDRTGKLVREATWTPMIEDPELTPLLWFSDGGTVLKTYSQALKVRQPAGWYRDSTTIAIGNRDGKVERIIGAFPHEGHLASSDGMMDYFPAFGPSGYFAVRDTFLIVGDNHQFGFDVYNRSGRPIQRVRRSFDKQPISDQDIIAFFNETRQEIGTPEPIRKEALTRAKSMPRFPFKPAFDRLIVASNGEVWLRHYDAYRYKSHTARYSVFDTAGQWITTVTAPIGLDLRWIGLDKVIGVWHDPDDVMHVRVHRLERKR